MVPFQGIVLDTPQNRRAEKVIGERCLPDWGHRSRHIAEERRAVQVVLPKVRAETDAELLLATAECAPDARRRWS